MIDFLCDYKRLSPTRIFLWLWMMCGSTVPLFILFEHRDHLSEYLGTQPEIFAAAIFSFLMIASFFTMLFLTELRMRKQTIVAKKQSVELEQLVAQRTKELQDALHELEIVASTDHLTKIHNRRFIITELQIAFNRTGRYGRDFSVIMIDIDKFKKINDEHGHPFGDKILIAVAKAIKNTVRDIDSVGRIGGEEFLVVLPDTELRAAAEVAERIRLAVKHIRVKGVSCTVSAGVTSSQFAPSMAAIIKQVDTALYDAKHNGRDIIRVVKPKDFTPCSSCVTVASCLDSGQHFCSFKCLKPTAK